MQMKMQSDIFLKLHRDRLSDVGANLITVVAHEKNLKVTTSWRLWIFSSPSHPHYPPVNRFNLYAKHLIGQAK